SVELFGQPIEKFKDWHKIGYVSQKSNAFNRGFPATVFEVVSMGLTTKIGYFKFFKQKHKEKVKHALKQVDMLEYMHQNIGDLSGGQQQRVFIARALVSNPEFLILDEPTVGIDQKNIKIFYELLHDLHRNKGITLLLVTHDVGTMTQHVDQVCCLNKKLHFHGDTDKYNALTDTELSNLYSHPVNLVQHTHQYGSAYMLQDILQLDFLRNTFFTGILIGIIAPLLGSFIVVRRLSLLADALSHVTLAGIAFGLLIEKRFAIPLITPFYGGLGFSVIGSLLIEKLRSVYKAYQELGIPIILSGGVGLSVIFIS